MAFKLKFPISPGQAGNRFRYPVKLFLAFILLIPYSVKGIDLLYSPDRSICVEVILKEKIYYSVYFKGERVLEASPLTLTVNNHILGADPGLLKFVQSECKEDIPVVWGSRRIIHDHYNLLKLDFKGDFSVEFRAYDQGVAYRFVTRLKEENVNVSGEEVVYRFRTGTSAWMLDSKGYESNYLHASLDYREVKSYENIRSKIFLPVIVQATSSVKIALTEAGLYDYPALFLSRTNDYENYLSGVFEKYALTTTTGGFSNYSQMAGQEADYIARTKGTREYPWRLMVITDDDRTLADCDLVWQLSKPCLLKETGWIKPGKVAWDWWHDYVVEGKEFRGGVNTETYLYHIDFAAKYGLEYILIDWMWTDKYDLTLINPEVDIERIIDYADKKNVRVIVWCPAHTLHRQLDKALDLFASLGIAGVKADFFGREDQTGIKMYEEIASEAAKRKLVVDFHGCTKPTGLSRTYPNILNYEAVAGNEWHKLEQKLTVDHKVIIPFTRALQGPMDYTPGGMRNLQTGYHIRNTLPVVQGTRSNEMALFVIYNEPLKMLCDAPSVYEREPEIIRFISGIPTVWDETHITEAKFGEYIISARKTGDTWYVAGITGEKERKVSLAFPFLENGDHSARLLKDGPNADRVGTDYLFETITVNKNSEVTIHLAPAGGFVMEINR